MTRRNEDSTEEGGVLVLAAGYLALALTTILLALNAGSLHLERLRLDALADAAALSATGDVDVLLQDGAPVPVLPVARSEERARALVQASGRGDEVGVEVRVPDGVSARVTLTAVWRPVLLSPLVPGGVEIVSSATARVAIG